MHPQRRQPHVQKVALHPLCGPEIHFITCYPLLNLKAYEKTSDLHYPAMRSIGMKRTAGEVTHWDSDFQSPKSLLFGRNMESDLCNGSYHIPRIQTVWHMQYTVVQKHKRQL